MHLARQLDVGDVQAGNVSRESNGMVGGESLIQASRAAVPTRARDRGTAGRRRPSPGSERVRGPRSISSRRREQCWRKRFFGVVAAGSHGDQERPVGGGGEQQLVEDRPPPLARRRPSAPRRRRGARGRRARARTTRSRGLTQTRWSPPAPHEPSAKKARRSERVASSSRAGVVASTAVPGAASSRTRSSQIGPSNHQWPKSSASNGQQMRPPSIPSRPRGQRDEVLGLLAGRASRASSGQ